MLILFLFSIIFCDENLIKNPSFEEFEDNKLKYWNVAKECEISSDSHTGKYSLYWKPLNKTIACNQNINVEKNYKYRICVSIKLKKIKNFQMYITSQNNTQDYRERYDSNGYKETNGWEIKCYTVGPIKRSSSDTNRFSVGFYTHAQTNETALAEIFVDDMSVYRIKDILKIAINNDRDEVYDMVNVIVQIKPNKGNNTLKDWDFVLKIKDGNNIIYEKNEKLISELFTIPIDITKMGLKDNNIYHIEGTVKSKIDNTTEIFTYPFKKINKIKREVTFDEYGRMFINDTLFFPFGIYLMGVTENDLIQVNKTHLNFILPYSQINKATMDMIYNTQKGKIKVMYAVNGLYNFNSSTCTYSNEEENYKKFVNKINEIKEHPALLSWYINDNMPSCLNIIVRNRTLKIHELDPNHPSLIVIGNLSDVNGLMNATDIMGIMNYPIGLYELNHRLIRNVYDANTEAYDKILEGKPLLPVIQIFDWEFYYRKTGIKLPNCPPTLQEIRSMSWQAFAAGGRGMLFYSLFDLFRMDNISSFEDRWKDVIEITEQIWKYKDMILSIEKVDKIEYDTNPNVTFKQWKYKNNNYIVVVNLERNDEIFKINLLKDYSINKEFGLGKIKKSGNIVTFSLKPIDVIMVKYNSKKNNNLVIIIIPIIVAIIILIIIGFFLRKYIMKKNKNDNFINTTSKLMNDE